MIRKPVFFKLTLGLLIGFAGAFIFAYAQAKSSLTSESKKEVQTRITYCNLELSEGWKLANLRFSSMYSFKVNEKGEAIEIKKITDDFVGEDKVKPCISSWKINGVAENMEFVASFKWIHGKGWVEQTISGKGFKQITNIEDVGVDKLVFARNQDNR